VPKVDISINGRLYPVACDDGQEERLRELGLMVDARVRQLAGPTPLGVVGETQILVLAGLMLADELVETQAHLASHHVAHGHAPAPEQAPVPEQAQPPEPDVDGLVDEDLLIAAVDHLTDRIGVIADRLSQA
jgi:cell division protein ZapA